MQVNDRVKLAPWMQPDAAQSSDVGTVVAYRGPEADYPWVVEFKTLGGGTVTMLFTDGQLEVVEGDGT